MLSSVSSPFIVRFVGYVKSPALLIVMEYVAGGTLLELIEARAKRSELLTFMETLDIFSGINSGLHAMHSAEPLPIIHRDIKCDNILLTEELSPRIADLGEARMVIDGKTMTTVGTYVSSMSSRLEGLSQ